ncbi:MAG: hypothetical protein PUJ47_03550 [Clostridia bacterium]|nr:hypothetical protein [Clostridia bacterium]
MLLSDFRRLRIAAEDCSSLEQYIAEEVGSLPEECYPADGSGDAPIKILTIIWELSHDFNFRKLRVISGLTQESFVREYRIPRRTIEHWDLDERTPPPYVLEMLAADVLSSKIKEVMGEN